MLGKRVLAVFSFMMCMFAAIIGRLYILTSDSEFIEAASRSGTYSRDVYKNRGTVYDCNMKKLTNREKVLYAAVLPNSMTFDALSPHVKSKKELTELLKEGEPFCIEVNSADISCRGVKVFEGVRRFSENGAAEHIIGYIDGDKNGVSGTEKAFDDFLKESSQTVSVRFERNAAGNVLDSDEAFFEITEKNDRGGVVLTIDEKIQNIAEIAAKKHISRGAVVVMDAQNGDIKASVSLPDFSPYNIAEVLDSEDSPLFNRAFASYNVGSTFKICTSAAALESGIDESFSNICTGSRRY